MAKPPPSLARRGVKAGVSRGKPLGLAVVMSARGAAQGASVSVMDAGDRDATAAVSAALGQPVRAPIDDDLIVCALTPRADLASVAERLADQRRAGGDVLVERTGESLTLSLPHIRLDKALEFLVGDHLK